MQHVLEKMHTDVKYTGTGLCNKIMEMFLKTFLGQFLGHRLRVIYSSLCSIKLCEMGKGNWKKCFR